jgi:hypothetical protein
VTSMQTISEIAVEKAKSGDPQTLREEEKDIVLLSKPPVNTSSPMDEITLQEQHQQAVKELAPKPSLHNPEPYKVKEQPKEKKSRFGFFGKKRTNEDRSNEEAEEVDKKEKYQLEDKLAVEQQGEEEIENEQKENQRARLKEEEKHKSDKERNLREDKDTKEQEENKVVYLTDEDIEDLLK